MKENKKLNYACGSNNGVDGFISINFGEGFMPILTDSNATVLEDNEKESLMLQLSSYSGEGVETGKPYLRSELNEDEIFTPNIGLVFHGEEGITSLRTLAKNFNGIADSWENYLDQKKSAAVLEKNISLQESGARIAEIQFRGEDEKFSKPYYFLTTIPNLLLGDLVVVETIHGLSVARFKKYKEASNFKKFTPSKWIVCRKGMIKEDISNYKIENKSESTIEK